MNLSKNLTLAEVTRSNTAKRLGINNEPTKEHLDSLKELAVSVFQPIRDHFNSPIYISSGYRSEELNKAIKGSSSSQHCKGEAIDIDMDGTNISNRKIFDFIKDNLEFDQLIFEFGTKENPDWVHVSYAKTNRREVLRAERINNRVVYSEY